MTKVQFIHGLHSSPQSAKARALAAEFNTLTLAMDTSDFAACVARQAQGLAEFNPDVLVGSSFGGAVALSLLQQHFWQGPTLLLAQAGRHCGLQLKLPLQTTVWIVHGSRDDIIDPDDSRKLAASAASDRVRLIEVDDDHVLTLALARGDLIDWVRQLAGPARP